MARYASEQARTLARQGDAQRAAANPGAARDAWMEAVAILDDLRHAEAEPVRGKLRQLGF